MPRDKTPIYIVDAFIMKNSQKLFTGNPAAVCLLEYDDDISNDHKQQVAMEMNLSETAFVSKLGWERSLGPNQLSVAPQSEVERRTVRWFTPTMEVPLCGHATLASAQVVKEIQLNDETIKKVITFDSKFKGKLPATLEQDGETMTLNFPSNPTYSLNPSENLWIDRMIKAIIAGGDCEFVQDIQYSPGTKILLLRLKDALGPKGLSDVTPNLEAMLGIDTGDKGPFLGAVVTVRGKSNNNNEVDFYSRFFAPWSGVNEDPVCGAAHTVLTPYWSKELGITDRPLKARQLSSRGGDLDCTHVGDRVKISGRAKIVLKGELEVK